MLGREVKFSSATGSADVDGYGAADHDRSGVIDYADLERE